MSTPTLSRIEKDIKTLDKNEFSQLLHFIETVNTENKEDFDIDFRELEEHEITPELRKGAEEALKAPIEDFIDLNEKYGVN